MIPKIIHYCWFGNKEIPEHERECMSSWGAMHPDFEVMRWDESNFPYLDIPFAAEAYKEHKWAFVADVARLYALKHYGGIYLDTDVKIVRPLDRFLSHSAFAGFEREDVIQTGVIGSEPDGNFINSIYELYLNRHFVEPDGSLNQMANSAVIARFIKDRHAIESLPDRLTILDDIVLYQSEVFCPIDQATWEIKVTSLTHCVHYLSGSWLPSRACLSRRLKRIVGSVFGYKVVAQVRGILLFWR